jgi:hypothetical protein
MDHLEMNKGFLSPLDLIMESLLDFMEERDGSSIALESMS